LVVRYHKSPKAQRLNNKITYVACRIAAPIIFLIGAAMVADRYEKLTTWEFAIGAIIGADHRDPGYSKTQTPLVSSNVRFQTADGREVIFDSTYSTTKSDEVGQTVSVRYDPQRPGNAVIVDFWDFWAQPPIIIALSVLLWFLGTAARTFVPPGLKAEDVLGADFSPKDKKDGGSNKS
jgi:Protein of unknown function (DUF3592).